MNRDFRISNDGTIFEIKEDGSISKLARIDESGTVSPLNRTNQQVTQTSRRNNTGCWFSAIAFIAALVFVVLYFSLKEDYYSASYRLELYQTQNKELKDKIQKIGNKIPFIITDIQIGNTYKGGAIQTDYGQIIHSSNSMFLTPKITYDGIKPGDYTLYYKIFYPNGSLSTGKSSPSGYSCSDSIQITEGEDNHFLLLGWGNENKGHWGRGKYRIEIWYNNSCLKSQTFTIY